MRKISSVLLMAVFALSACKESFKKGDDGIEYKIIKDGKGETVAYGDYMQMNMTQYYQTGTKDSVLMAQLFKLAGYQFSIAHCNFNLRVDEAQRDESFVKLLAAVLAVPYYVEHFDTKAYASEHHISTQMAARDLRYQWFEERKYQSFAPFRDTF